LVLDDLLSSEAFQKIIFEVILLMEEILHPLIPGGAGFLQSTATGYLCDQLNQKLFLILGVEFPRIIVI